MHVTMICQNMTAMQGSGLPLLAAAKASLSLAWPKNADQNQQSPQITGARQAPLVWLQPQSVGLLTEGSSEAKP